MVAIVAPPFVTALFFLRTVSAKGWRPYLSPVFAAREPICTGDDRAPPQGRPAVSCVGLSTLKDLCPALGDKRVVKALGALPPSLLVDVGSHDGATAQLYARAGHRVLGFEPSPSMVKVASLQCHSWPPRARQTASEGLTRPLCTREKRPSASDLIERPWPAIQRPPKSPFSLRLTMQIAEQGREAARADAAPRLRQRDVRGRGAGQRAGHRRVLGHSGRQVWRTAARPAHYDTRRLVLAPPRP